MNVIPLLLFLLVANSSKAKGVDSLVYVGPIVNSVVVGSKTLEPEGISFALCSPTPSTTLASAWSASTCGRRMRQEVKASLRYCAVTFGKERLSLAASEQQDAELSNMSWKEFELSFDLSYVAMAPGASTQSSVAP